MVSESCMASSCATGMHTSNGMPEWRKWRFFSSTFIVLSFPKVLNWYRWGIEYKGWQIMRHLRHSPPRVLVLQPLLVVRGHQTTTHRSPEL